MRKAPPVLSDPWGLVGSGRSYRFGSAEFVEVGSAPQAVCCITCGSTASRHAASFFSSSLTDAQLGSITSSRYKRADARTNERMNKLPGPSDALHAASQQPGVRICRAMQRAGSDRGHKPRWEGSVEGYRKSDGESDGVKRGEMPSE